MSHLLREIVAILLFGLIISCQGKGKKENKNQNNSTAENTNTTTPHNNNNLQLFNNNNNDLSMDAQELCLLYYVARELNNKYYAICSSEPYNDLDELTDLEKQYICRPGGSLAYDFAERLLRAKAEGRVKIKWDIARACLEQARYLRKTYASYELIQNNEWNDLKEHECFYFYQGLVDDKEPCVEDWDCINRQQGCYTGTPTIPGSRICMLPAKRYEHCVSFYLPCEEGTVCHKEINKDIGVCDVPNNPHVRVGFGEPCLTVDDCMGPCVKCDTDTYTCTMLHGEGQSCESWADCVYNLGCTNGVCTTVGLGDACGPLTQNWCHAHLQCVHRCMQYLNRYDCLDAGCNPDDDAQVCLPPVGEDYQCLEIADAKQPCSAGFLCQPEHYCDSITARCVPFALLGDACFDVGQKGARDCYTEVDKTACNGRMPICYWQEEAGECEQAPFCPDIQDRSVCNSLTNLCVYATSIQQCVWMPYCPDISDQTQCISHSGHCCWDESTTQCDYAPFCYMDLNYWCDQGSCFNACDQDAQCPTEHYCDLNGKCHPLSFDACQINDECPNDHFCSNCESYGDQELGDQLACEQETKCKWDSKLSLGVCVPNCRAHTDAYVCNNVKGCAWMSEIEECVQNCYVFPADEDPALCNAAEGCQVITTSECDWHVDCSSLTTEIDCQSQSTDCFFDSAQTKCLPICDKYHQNAETCALISGCRYVESNSSNSNSTSNVCETVCENLAIEQCVADSNNKCRVLTSSRCDIKTRCYEMSLEPEACDQSADCFYVPHYACQHMDPNTTFTCLPQKAIGMTCLNDSQCLNQGCRNEEENGQIVYRCAYEMHCVSYNFALLQSVFMLGGIWIVVRRRNKTIY